MHRSAAPRILGIAASALISTATALGLIAPGAMAAGSKSQMAVCEGQSFSQQFLEYGDHRFYTPLPGGEFNEGEDEGWTLSGGAAVVSAVRPDGSLGGVLSLPVGGRAISPSMCVTLAYPIARSWVDGSGGGKGISVSVAYAGSQSEAEPEEVGKIVGRGSWGLGRFNVAPALGGSEEAPREVRFIFEGRKGTNELFGIYVDPRMSR